MSNINGFGNGISRACYEARQSSAILVQVYSAMNGETWYQSLAENILKKLPAAVIVGTSTFGEIAEGHTLTGQTVIGFTFFHSTSVTSISLPCTNNNEVSVGEQLRQTISNLDQPVSGVLLLATPLSINVADFLQGFQSDKSNYPVFGGGAGIMQQCPFHWLALEQPVTAAALWLLYSQDLIYTLNQEHTSVGE